MLLKNLLSEDGFIFVQIDSNEMAYLRVLMDEVFGRTNFINDIIWKRRGGAANPSNRLNNVVDYVLWYSKSDSYEITPVFTKDDENTQKYIEERFKGDFKGRKYMLAPIERNKKLGLRETMRYEYNGYIPEWGWMMSKENLIKMDKSDRLHWNSKGRPNRRVFLEDYPGQPVGNLWTDIKVVNPMAIERLDFDGQKPEALISRILELTTKLGDLVLDSFSGTGTTGATAHKMGRKWIMVELGEQCHSFIIPRLTKLIKGRDEGGISKAVNWKGGGGFRYYRLAPSMLEKDKWGNWVISKDYNAVMLTEAMCKHMGFTYAPDKNHYWMHGYSTETDFIYITTSSLTHEHLRAISEEVGPHRTLLICCKAFNANAEVFDNLTLKKIPQVVLKKCEWGKDDYSLNVTKLQSAKSNDQVEPDLFNDESEDIHS